MKVRIKFDADIVIEANDMADVKTKWESLPLFTKEAMEHSVEFGEVILVEDAETYEDLMNHFLKPNEQSGTRSDYAVAENGRMKFNDFDKC